MNDRRATVRPWSVNKYGSIGAGELGILPIVAEVVPLFDTDQKHGDHMANAALIVRAVNERDGMIEALRGIVAQFPQGVPFHQEALRMALRRACEVLARAEAEDG